MEYISTSNNSYFFYIFQAVNNENIFKLLAAVVGAVEEAIIAAVPIVVALFTDGTIP